MSDVYQALDWWRTSSAAEKEKAIKKWKAQKDLDYRKNWDAKRIGLSDSTVMEVYKFAK